MAYIIGTPALIVPALLALSRWWTTPDVLAVAVVAFATLGHHLPGYMRAYGDQELFARFRWRFLLAPPILFLTTLLLAAPNLFVWPPRFDSLDRLYVSPEGLHGLELIAAFWGTWHGLMQTYGFMRIYDVRQRRFDRASARLDLALCIAIFAAGVVFSQTRVYAVMAVVWKAGIPTLDRSWLVGAQWTVAVAGAVVLALYVWRQIVAEERSRVVWPKIALAASTGGLYWFAGTLTQSVLIGVAMFEVFHAVQYYAIVWIYNRGRYERTGGRFGSLAFLFRRQKIALALYLAAIAGFGGLYLVANRAASPMAQTILLAAFTASSLLHYYYDGFIWKVREKKTRENLDGGATIDAADSTQVGAAVHLGKWGLLYALLIALTAMELTRSDSPEQEREYYASLARWTPDVAELQITLSKRRLIAGDAEGAIELARRATDVGRRWHVAHAALADALLQAGRLTDAEEEMETAIELAPNQASHRYTLGQILADQGEYDRAIEQFRAAESLAGNRSEAAEAAYQLGAALFTLKRYEAAAAAYRRAIDGKSDWGEAVGNLGAAQLELGQIAEAKATLEEALRLSPNSAAAHYNMSRALALEGKTSESSEYLRRARALGL